MALIFTSHIVFFYALSAYKSLGCWKDGSIRAIPTLEGAASILDGDYTNRSNAIEKCGRAAEDLGYTVFALQHGGYCSSSPYAGGTYDMYGPANNCAEDGKGGGWANHVYQLITGKLNLDKRTNF